MQTEVIVKTDQQKADEAAANEAARVAAEAAERAAYEIVEKSTTPRGEVDQSKVEELKKAQTAPASEKSSEADRNMALAKQALKRDGWEDADIDAMLPDQLLKVGLKRKAHQDEQARKFAADQKRKAQESKTRSEEVGNADEPADAASGADDPDTASEVDPTGDDKGLDEKLAAADMDRTQAVLLGERLESSRRELSQEFRGISTDSVWKLVLSEMDAIDPGAAQSLTGRSKVVEVMRKAATKVFQDLRTATQQSGEPPADLDGQPHVGFQRPSDSSTMTREEIERLAFNIALKTNGNTLEAKRQFEKAMGR